MRGRASLSLEDGTFITDDCWCEDTGPGNTITYQGIRYEVVRNLWWSKYTPSGYLVKVWGK